MTEPFDLTGAWSGHYVQHDAARGLAVRFEQRGDRLTGTMRDADTRTERRLFDVFAEAGLPPGADEQVTRRLREEFPDDGGPIRFVTSLPSESLIEGHVRARTVSFVKTYQGEHFSGYTIGERRVGVTIERHAVHYRGRLSDDGNTLEGDWWIDPDLRCGMVRRAKGRFVLRRE